MHPALPFCCTGGPLQPRRCFFGRRNHSPILELNELAEPVQIPCLRCNPCSCCSSCCNTQTPTTQQPASPSSKITKHAAKYKPRQRQRREGACLAGARVRARDAVASGTAAACLQANTEPRRRHPCSHGLCCATLTASTCTVYEDISTFRFIFLPSLRATDGPNDAAVGAHWC